MHGVARPLTGCIGFDMGGNRMVRSDRPMFRALREVIWFLGNDPCRYSLRASPSR